MSKTKRGKKSPLSQPLLFSSPSLSPLAKKNENKKQVVVRSRADLRRQNARVPQGVPGAPGAGLVLDRPRDGEAQDGHALVVGSFFICLFLGSRFLFSNLGGRESTKSTNPVPYYKNKRERESRIGEGGGGAATRGGRPSRRPFCLSHPLSLRFSSPYKKRAAALFECPPLLLSP